MDDLTFETVSLVNAARAHRWHRGFPNHRDGWTGADWSNAAAGEMGEACNVVKKLRRIETGIQQAEGSSRVDLLAKLATEIGDTFIYLDLLAQFYGLRITDCVRDTFNRVSEREGFPERIEPTSPPEQPELRYLLWSNKLQAWWGPDAWGYTEDKAKAGRYSRMEAMRHVAQSADSGDLDRVTCMVVDAG